MEKVKVVILKNELHDDHLLWEKSCILHANEISYRIVDLTKNNWLVEIQAHPSDYLLSKPGAFTSAFKQLYDERIYILSKILNYNIYPSDNEVFVYENKRFLSYFLKANSIAHPATNIYYYKSEALQYLNYCRFPIVAKTNIGASGRGVVVLKSLSDAKIYIDNVFSGRGATKSTGPNFSKSGWLKRGVNYLFNPGKLFRKLAFYKSINKDIQKDFLIFQDYIPHEFEWRVVRIGDSFFAHKKLKLGEKASGSLLKNYDNPPLELFDFVKKITDKHQFYSQAIDVFQVGDLFLVNEMQCIFGQSDSFQMMVDGRIGRYRYIENNWKFEEGDFNQLECYSLRIQHVIDKSRKR
jgi:glutathione synthase/RimK-type ligase-like ATP-grasp enzyme